MIIGRRLRIQFMKLARENIKQIEPNLEKSGKLIQDKNGQKTLKVGIMMLTI